MNTMPSQSKLGRVATGTPWHRLAAAEAVAEQASGKAREIIGDLVEHAVELERMCLSTDAPAMKDLKEELEEATKSLKEAEEAAAEAEDVKNDLTESLRPPWDVVDGDIRGANARRIIAHVVQAMIRAEPACPWCSSNKLCTNACIAQNFIEMSLASSVQFGPAFPGLCDEKHATVGEPGTLCGHGKVFPPPVEGFVILRRTMIHDEEHLSFKTHGKFWLASPTLVQPATARDELDEVIAGFSVAATRAQMRVVTLAEATAIHKESKGR